MRRYTLSKRLPKRLGVAVVAATTALTLGSCTIGLGEDSGAEKSVPGTVAPSPTTGEGKNANASDDGQPNPTAAPDASAAQMPSDIVAAVAQVQQEFGGVAGAAIATAGNQPNAVTTGDLQVGPAWSTSKVPIAVAVVRQSGVDDRVRAAITVSDNAAAEAMWTSLGDAPTASATTTQILREGHDNTTVVETQRVRPEFSIFGQTQWALGDQATFGANLQCVEAGPQVADLMGQIAADQAYGLGQIPGARFKGGWGPDESGHYLVRQFGFVPGSTPGTFVGVAIAAKPADGSYATGQQMLNRIAQAISGSGAAAVAEHAGGC